MGPMEGSLVSILSPIVDRIYGGGPLYGDALFGGGLSSIAPSGNFTPEIGTPYAQHLLGGGIPAFGRGRYGGSGLLTGGGGGMGGILQSIFGNDPVLLNLIGAALSFRPQFQNLGEEESASQSGGGGSVATDHSPPVKEPKEDDKKASTDGEKKAKKGKGKGVAKPKATVEVPSPPNPVDEQKKAMQSRLAEIQNQLQTIEGDFNNAVSSGSIPPQDILSFENWTEIDLFDPGTADAYPIYFSSPEVLEQLQRKVAEGGGGEIILNESDSWLYWIQGHVVKNGEYQEGTGWKFKTLGLLDQDGKLYQDPKIQSWVREIQVLNREEAKLLESLKD